jgi:glutathione-regulated potassium-efflux system ancillary protein KefC/glutathione-regulated potassium-efflux system protein KefB
MHLEQFLLQSFIYLAAAVISVPIAKRLGLGSVLGYLVAGVLIGPFALGLTPKSDAVMHFAEFGVVMMLFIVGLELRPSSLWTMRRPILGLGGGHVLATSMALGAAAIAMGLDWRQALAVGMVLSLSSTAIVLQTLSEKGLMATGAGRSTFAVLLFQDIAVIPMLAFLPLLAVSGVAPATTDHASVLSALPAWAQGLVVLGCVAGIVLAGHFVMRPILRIVAGAKLREIFTAAALCLVVGIAVLMNFIGLSPALGTFIAGVVLADNEYRHELEADIEPFKGLLRRRDPGPCGSQAFDRFRSRPPVRHAETRRRLIRLCASTRRRIRFCAVLLCGRPSHIARGIGLDPDRRGRPVHGADPAVIDLSRHGAGAASTKTRAQARA